MNKSSGTPLLERLEHALSNYTRLSQLRGSPSFNPDDLPETELTQFWAWEIDHSGQLIWCSPEVTYLTGFMPDELQGRTAFEPLLETASMARLQKALQSARVFRDLLLEGTARDGRHLEIAFSGQPRGHSGNAFGAAHLIRSEPLQTTPDGKPSESISPGTEPLSFLPGVSTSAGYILDENGFGILPDPLEEPVQAPVLMDYSVKIPILSGNTCLGILELDRSPDEPGWTEDEIVLLQNLAIQLASAVQDARSYELTLKALEEMQQADHLKSQLLANMSHELRTPLNSIIGFSSVILKGIDGPINETQEQDIHQIYNAGQHLLGLINNVLDLSKIEADKMQLALNTVDLASIIQEVVEIANALIKQKPVELLVDIPADVPLIEADSTRVRQILLNLISNAVKFTDQGHIGIFVRSLPSAPGREIIISVVDTGIGITPEDQLKLFQPFSQIQETTSRPGSGTGLGLSICRHLVELHHGRIWVESTPGTGSTFSFTLPVTLSEAPSEPIPAALSLITENENTTDRLHRLLPEYRIQTFSSAGLADASVPDSLLLAEIPFNQERLWNLLYSLSQANQLNPVQLFALNDGNGIILPPVRLSSLPLTEHKARHLVNLSPSSAGENQEPLMLVDTDPDSLENMSRLFTDSGGAVQSFHDARSALGIIRSSTPEVVLFNLFMPNADGFRILETIRSEQLYVNMECVMMIPESPAGHEGLQFLRYIQHLYDHNAEPLQSVVDHIQQCMLKYHP